MEPSLCLGTIKIKLFYFSPVPRKSQALLLAISPMLRMIIRLVIFCRLILQYYFLAKPILPQEEEVSGADIKNPSGSGYLTLLTPCSRA
jgi:hypothetical protein